MPETKRERNKLLISVMIIIAVFMLLLGGYFVYRYYFLNKSDYVKLSEKSELDYKVCLKENNFYDEKCIDKNNQYVASLIDYIPANFSYDLKFLGKNIDFKYTYKVEARFNVIDKDNKRTLFTKKEVLYESPEKDTVNEAHIKYDLNIDYNKYNDLLSNFVTIYDLDETINDLNVYLKVDVIDDGDTFVEKISKDSVVSLSIPLTRKTVDVNIRGVEGISDTDVLIKNNENNVLNLISASICVFISLSLIAYVVYYYLSTRTVLEIYQNRIKKITSSYDSYIQRISGSYPIGASQICKVVSFRDMLEIKDTSDKPLLMLENEAKTGTFFMIPVGEGVIYTYALRVEDIMAEKDGTNPPDYDLTDFDIKEEKPKRKKKYTKEKIKKDIESTTMINILDDKNAIKGTKNNNESLYDQLEKTATFRAIKDSYYFPDTKIKRKKKTTKKKKK